MKKCALDSTNGEAKGSKHVSNSLWIILYKQLTDYSRSFVINKDGSTIIFE